MNLARIVASTSLLAAALAALPARAGDDPQALFDRGVAELEAGRFEAACPSIQQSYEIDPRPGTLFTLAECETRRGHLAAAVARYDEYLALYPTLPPDKRAKQGDREKMARAQRAALGAKVAELTLLLGPGAPAGTVVTRDGAAVDARSLGVSVPLDPGEHVIAVQAPGGAPRETRVTLAAGEKRAVALEPPARVEVAPPPAAGANKAVLIAGGAVGGAAVLAGVIMAGLYASKASAATSDYKAFGPTGSCPPASAPDLPAPCAALASALDAKAAFGSAAVGLLVVGGVVGGATILYGVLAPRGAPATGLRVLPLVAGSGGGILVEGAL